MADTPTFQPNPYANFDPSQWTNPYSQYAGKALPWPSSYSGWPTNALGQPIQPPPGMTLNSSPQQPQAPAQPQAVQSANSQPVQPVQPGTPWTPQTAAQNAAYRAQQQAMMGQPVYGDVGRMGGQIIGYTQPQSQMPQQAAAPQAAAPQGAPGQPSYSQVLSMLANPGQVTTRGATVPQAASSATPGPGVLQSFLQNWKPASSGPGSGFTQNFNTILRGLQGSK